MKEHVSQVYLNEHALLLFSCTVWRQTDRAHAKHAALACLEVHGLATDRPCADEGRGTGVINLVMTVQFGAQSFDAIFDELLIKFLLKNTT